MSVFMGEEVLEALRVEERSERRTARREVSLFCIAVLRSLLCVRRNQLAAVLSRELEEEKWHRSGYLPDL